MQPYLFYHLNWLCSVQLHDRGKRVDIFCDSLGALTYLSTNHHKGSLSPHNENALWSLVKASSSACSLNLFHVPWHAERARWSPCKSCLYVVLFCLAPPETSTSSFEKARPFYDRPQNIKFRYENQPSSRFRQRNQSQDSLLVWQLLSWMTSVSHKLLDRMYLAQTDTWHICNTGRETPVHLWYCSAHFSSTLHAYLPFWVLATFATTCSSVLRFVRTWLGSCDFCPKWRW